MGLLGGAVTFIGAWIYCMSEYGFLFGFGLGWLPAAILAVMVGFALRYLWWLAAIFLGLGLLSMCTGS